MPLFALKRMRTAAAITVLACGSAWLTGCTSEPAEGGVKGAPPSATTPSETDSGTTPTDPSDAGGAHARIPDENKNLKVPDFKDYPGITENTDEGAEQTLRFYFDAMYYGYATGDTEPLESISNTDACETCSSAMKQIDASTSQGDFAIPGEVVVTDLAVVETTGDRQRGVYIEFERRNFRKLSEGEGPKNSKDRRVVGAGKLSFSDEGGWKVNAVEWDNAN